ncbi:unnamed protein product [Urochloa decumbens]|uniref:Receptor kinase-like protein Xa21 n=1 Tax=Urochloa decumbens TaxID=240449 RepID=A0ABC9AIM6_9POAL
MATRSACLLLLLLLLLSASMFFPGAEADDEAALLAFKAAASVRGNGDALASWNASADGGYCSWEGIICWGKHRQVVSLSLPSHGLTGILSPAIGNLSSLRILNLTSNEFSGNIPASLGCLHDLRILNLSHNAFSGPLTAGFSSCTTPAGFNGTLKHLEALDLRRNNFIGGIPASLANLSSLQILDLSENQLRGTIPTSLGILKDLWSLDLGYNDLSGEPVSLYNLSLLERLQIQSNMLNGSIPIDIGRRFPGMQILSLHTNQFTGSIPTSLTNLTSLQLLNLAVNNLSGFVPRTVGRLGALQYLFFSNNMLEAKDDGAGWEFITSLSNCTQLVQFDITSNAAFTGHLPSSIVNLSATLQVLGFGGTGIRGSIPSAIGNLAGLQVVGVQDTFISGVIPDSIGKLGNLTEFFLYNTSLSGQIPSSIGNLSKLASFVARHANLEGPIPASIGKLNSILTLDLSMNRLNGSISSEIFKLPSFSFNYLDLSYNSLSGLLPSELGSLANLNSLFLSGNQLSGKIPESIGKCTVLEEIWLENNLFNGSMPQYLSKGLIILNLSMNNLSGTIPDAIGNIRGLQQLSLAHNNLSGLIPSILQNLTSLSMLDLSFNSLQGEVPKEGIFRNMANLSITGNSGLCGGIPQLHLAPCKTDSVKKNRRRHFKYLTIGVSTTGALLLLAIITALIHLIYKKQRQKQKSQFQPPIVEEQYERVTYHALENGTNGFSEANLLGKGSFGTVYKCAFQGEGTIVAVKVFNIEQCGSIKSFIAECEALRRVRHRCLMKIITCCSSINQQGQEFKALVFEFMPNGSLHFWLHKKSDMPTLNNTLSLAQRLDIAVDIMDVLDYLHNHCQPPIVHCDLKPSNILLAEDMSARVGDFGISRILSESASRILQNSNSTIGIRGSIGYIAPEYGEGSSVTTLGDVYSLGILLLEMFTGRSPTDDMFIGSLDIRKYSEDALPDKIWEIADTTMWLHTDTYDYHTRNKIDNCLGHVIALGISCSREQPRERTLIQDAATEMHAIRDLYRAGGGTWRSSNNS